MTASEQIKKLMERVARGEISPEQATARVARFAVSLALAAEGHSMDGLDDLRHRMSKGRTKYPNGCTLNALADEMGEVERAVNKREGIDRVRDELLDVAAVAMRLFLGEVDVENDAVSSVHRGLAPKRRKGSAA